MKNRISSACFLLVIILAIFCLSGCSCLVCFGNPIGDPNTYKGSISKLNLDSLPSGRVVVVNLADGNRIRGEYIGLDSLEVEKDSAAEEVKTPFLTAIAVRDSLDEYLIPVEEVERIEVKAKRLTPGQAFLVGLVIDTAIFVFFCWSIHNAFSNM
jgi:hypothetical protein